MSNPANPPGREPGGIAADLANLAGILDACGRSYGWQVCFGDDSDAALDSARAFVSFLRDFADLVDDEASAEAFYSGPGAPIPGRDRRYPGGVPGPAPGDLPGAAFAFPAGHIPEPEPVNTTPEPAYRAPLEGTTPPEGREFRCGTCGRGFAGHVMAGCPCGGEIVIVDPDDGQTRTGDPHELRTIELGQYGQTLTCLCGFSVSAFDRSTAERTMRGHIDSYSQVESA